MVHLNVPSKNRSCVRKQLTICGLLLSSFSIGQPTIIATIDLRDQTNDRLEVELRVPQLGDAPVVFALPRIVPGIYGTMDHGRLAGGIGAFDSDGDPIPIQRLDVNRWTVPEPRTLHRITYSVDDGWEEFDLRYSLGNYRSSEGTVKSDAVVLNHNTVIGYFEGHETLPYTIHLKKPTTHYAATSLPRTAESEGSITLKAMSYRHLVDNPVLVAQPDTAHIRLQDINVLVACHSTTGQAIAQDIAKEIRPLLADQRDYLGGTLPVKDYTFLIYHHPNEEEGSMMGDGLEHSASTLILLCMPLDPEMIAFSVYGIASHEFFHTILPLSVHSEEIAQYDFNNPRMSRHLWLYEGMTEYFAIHMPIKQGRQSVEEFLDVLNGKIKDMSKFPDDIALTTLSQQAMERQDQFYNFYLKGTLFCMGLDIALRERSKGAYGVQQLIQDLQREYGPGTPFKDEELFATIERLTGPDIGALLQRHLSEPSELPLDEWLDKAGIVMNEMGQLSTMGSPTKDQRRLRSWWLGR
jgi:predicted metalloprotease with PDZ domain